MLALDEHVALALVEEGSRLAPLDRAVLLAATLDGVSAATADIDSQYLVNDYARIVGQGAGGREKATSLHDSG